MVVHGACRLRRLQTDLLHPAGILQASIMVVREQCEIFGLLQLASDKRAAQKKATATLQTVRHYWCGRYAPAMKQHEVLPFSLYPRPTDKASQPLAGAPVALDVIAHAVALDANDFRQRVRS